MFFGDTKSDYDPLWAGDPGDIILPPVYEPCKCSPGFKSVTNSLGQCECVAATKPYEDPTTGVIIPPFGDPTQNPQGGGVTITVGGSDPAGTGGTGTGSGTGTGTGTGTNPPALGGLMDTLTGADGTQILGFSPLVAIGIGAAAWYFLSKN